MSDLKSHPIEDEKDAARHVEDTHLPQVDPESQKPKYSANTQLDDAAKLLEEAGGHVEYTAADQKRVLRKIDLFVCLPMCLVYFIQQVSAIVAIGTSS